MEQLLLLIPIGIAGAVMFSLMFAESLRFVRNAMLGTWRDAAFAAGLTGLETVHTWRHARLVGLAGRFRVEFSRRTRNQDETLTHVRIEGLPPSLTVKLENAFTLARRGHGHRDLEVGDDAFDDEVFLQGPPALLHAVMDAGMRLRVRSMLGNDVVVRGGALSATVEDRYASGSGVPLKAMLPLLLEFAGRLARPADLVERLAANALDDPTAGVRRQNLLVLAREYPEHALTRPTITRAVADPVADVRLTAARLLGAEGRAVLTELAVDERTDDVCAGRAVAALGAELPEPRVLEVLGHALRGRRLETGRACLDALGRLRSDAAFATLAKVLARENGELAEAAARALGAAEDARSEAPLVTALTHPSPAVQVAAAESLGRTGTAGAVEPLKQAERLSGDGAFRRAARQAIARIQSRAGSAAPGQLTLAEGESGRLSLEDDTAGHVSLAASPEGASRLSGAYRPER
jgi:hypothetical protein